MNEKNNQFPHQIGTRGKAPQDHTSVVPNSEFPPSSQWKETKGQQQNSHNDVPLGLRNKRMKPTDCLLFAATILSEKQQQQQLLLQQQQQQTPSHSSSSLPITPTSTSSSTEHVKSELLTSSSTVKHPLILPKVHSYSNGSVRNSAETPILPSKLDVLCGRGGLVNKHPGNVIYRKVVDYNKPYYQNVQKRHRTMVSQSIVQAILNFGGRFLIMGDPNGRTWMEVEYKRAVQKTSQALRERSSNPIEDGEEGEYNRAEDSNRNENYGDKNVQDEKDENGNLRS